MAAQTRRPRRAPRPEAPKTHHQTREKRSSADPAQPSSTIDLGFDVGEVGGLSLRPAREPGPPAVLPPLAVLDRCAVALPGSPAASWLADRGLSEEAIAAAHLGLAAPADPWWSGKRDGHRPAIVIPLVRDGLVYNVKRRFLDGINTPEHPKYRVIAGRPHGLYPGVPPGESVVLCEGEFDALIARQHGLPAVCGTAGMWTWESEWSASFAGRRVAVCFDAGGECHELAEDRVRQLLHAGAREAWPVDLTLAGFRPGEDLSDWFVKYGWSAADLRAFVNDAYRHRQEAA